MNEILAAWLPAPIMAALLAVLVSVIWKNIAKRFDKVEEALLILPKLATKEELGNMGNRFDERHSSLRERVSVIEAVSK